jgi:pimeloyl-ACP methyl ester carboxylesterase
MNHHPTVRGNAQDQLSPGGHYAEINGLKMYYEVHGSALPAGAVPLVLLHGTFSATGTSFGALLPGLSAGRRVIAIEQQAHGHTADIDRPLSVQQMSEDTASLLRQLGVAQANLFGYSLGTGIALYIALHHPKMVRKLVLAGGVTYNRAGFYPGLLEGMDGLKPEFLVGSPFHEEYLRIAPQPEDFPRLVEKVKELNKNLPDLSPEDIRSIQAPALLAIGDADISRPEHVVEMFYLLGGGMVSDPASLPKARLAILPGTTHVSLVGRADWLVSMVNEFLAA